MTQSHAKVHRPRPAPWLFERIEIALMVGGFLLLPIAIWWPAVNLADPATISAGIWLVGLGLAAVAAMQLGEKVNAIYRNLRGLPPAAVWEHCEHCTEMVGVRDQLDALITYAHDSYNALEVIRDSAGRTATAIDELAADEKPVALR